LLLLLLLCYVVIVVIFSAIFCKPGNATADSR